MIKGILFIIAAVISTHPAGNPGARLLTVEESVGQGPRSMYPERVSLWWDASSRLTKDRPAYSKPTYTLPQSEGPGIVYGQSVSRNEFGISGGVFPSPDGKKLAVYRKDESAVSMFPLFDITTRTGSTRELRYPMAGMASEKISVCICDTSGHILATLKVDDFDEERYLTGVTWSPDGKYIFVQVLDRPQHNLRLNMYRASDGSFVRTLLTEHNDAWVEPQEGLHFIKDSYDFIYSTDNRDGYRNLYLCDTLGRIRRLTPCNADVHYLANDGKSVFYTSAEVSPIENHLFKVGLKGLLAGRPKRLTSSPPSIRLTSTPSARWSSAR